MRRWVAKVRGLLGLSAVGGAIGGAFGLVWEVITWLLGAGGLSFGTLGWSATLWAAFGAFAAGGVGVFIAAVGSKGTLEELSAWQAGAGGAVMGALAPPALVFLMTGTFSAPAIALVSGLSAAFGGLLGAGLVVTAKRAHAAELGEGGPRGALGRGR